MKWLLIFGFWMGLCPLWGQLPAIELLDKEKEVRLPFEYYYNFILVEAKINGIIPLTLIFDTGAENCILFDKRVTDMLRMPYDKEITLRGSDQSRDIEALICRRLNLNFDRKGWVSTDIIVLKEDVYDMFAWTGKKIDGIIGTSFFKGLVMGINYRKKYISFHRPESFVPPEGYFQLPMTIRNDKPHMHAITQLDAQNEVELFYLLDSGAGLPAMLHNNTDDAITIPSEAIGGYLGTGIGGQLQGYLSRIQAIEFGNVQVNNLILGYQKLDSTRMEDTTFIRNGLIGNPILRKFDPIFDYSRYTLWLRPNKYFDEPLKVDRSGIIPYAGGKSHSKFYIKDILPNSPAHNVGLLPGDQILTLNGWPVFWFDLPHLVKKWQAEAGTEIKMKIRRGKEKMKVRLVLQDLI